MDMNIYKQEHKDGLSQALANTSVTCECDIVECLNVMDGLDEVTRLAIATTANPDQIDLYYLNAILASAGWNKNDDVFGKKELIAAVQSPVDKPFNLMHDNSEIIGHITDSCLVDHNFRTITAEEASGLETFDIVISAVLYRLAPLSENRSMIELIEEIESGEWKVSMECLFRDFDYAITTPDGQNKILVRDENSAFLTKHLRVYGGDGVYEQYRIGRFLRNVSFTGVGLVTKPANPRSKIIRNNPFNEVQSSLREIYMSVAQEDFDKLSVQVAELSKNLEDSKKLASDKDVLIAGLTKELEEVKSSLKLEVEAKAGLQTKLDAIESQAKADKRKAALANLVDETKATDLLSKFANTSDEVFEAMVAVLQPQKTIKDEKLNLKTEKTEASLLDGGHDIINTNRAKQILAAQNFLKKNKKVKE